MALPFLVIPCANPSDSRVSVGPQWTIEVEGAKCRFTGEINWHIRRISIYISLFNIVLHFVNDNHIA